MVAAREGVAAHADTPPGLTEPARGDLYDWRLLRLLALYRLVVAMVLMLGAISGVESLLLSPDQPMRFEQTAIGYFLFALNMLILSLQFTRYFQLQVHLHTLGDILLLGLLIYFTGLEDNGLGPLILIAVAGGSILVGMRTAAFFAAVASLALLLQHFLHYAEFREPGLGYAQVGLLGIVVFAASLLTSYLATRARDNAALAARRGVDLANMQTLNAHIVQRLQVGALVVDGDDRVRLLNDAAWGLLEQPPSQYLPSLQSLSPALHQAVSNWRSHPHPDHDAGNVSLGEGMEIQPRFVGLGEEGGALVFLEDLSGLRARVQEAKLASLGRLTASIAHEIRNPLSAMTHACQLLEEAELQPADRRLLEIIRKQGLRLNGIINSVLGMSRREKPNQDTVLLLKWLADFREELTMQHQLEGLQLDLTGVLETMLVDFDPDHLGQVVNNLVRNAVEHSGRGVGDTVVSLTAGVDARGKPWLDVQDNGKGIATDNAVHLFEPFFSTGSNGTGLGLYVCRELCESNQAKLVLRHGTQQGACFRITFAGPMGRQNQAQEQQR